MCNRLERRLGAACKAGLGLGCRAVAGLFDHRARKADTYEAKPRGCARANAAYQKGCDAGDSESCTSLGHNCLQFEGCNDKARAARLFARACEELRDARGCNSASDSYRLGRGVKRDPARARRYNARWVELRGY